MSDSVPDGPWPGVSRSGTMSESGNENGGIRDLFVEEGEGQDESPVESDEGNEQNNRSDGIADGAVIEDVRAEAEVDEFGAVAGDEDDDDLADDVIATDLDPGNQTTDDAFVADDVGMDDQNTAHATRDTEEDEAQAEYVISSRNTEGLAEVASHAVETTSAFSSLFSNKDLGEDANGSGNVELEEEAAEQAGSSEEALDDLSKGEESSLLGICMQGECSCSE